MTELKETEQKKLPEGFDWKAFTPEDSPKTPMDLFADAKHQDLSTASLQTGDQAFGFARPVYDFSTGQKVETGQTFDLLVAAKEKPVALIFGSYT